MGDIRVREAGAADHDAIVQVLMASWGSTTVVVHGSVYDAAQLPALLAERDGRVVGLLTYTIADHDLEVVSLDAVVPRAGVGGALLSAAADLGRRVNARRLWLITTNDNLDALRFYQRRGMRIIAVAPGAMDAARKITPSIPLVGRFGIALRDELTLELQL
jgi:GNAT superfamily N-acetyltransferase